MTTETIAARAARTSGSWRRSLLNVGRVIAKRLGQLIIVVLLLVVGTALLVRLIPGDPATAILGLQATPEAIARLRAELGLDRPVLAQVADQILGLLRGDLGTSVTTQQPVAEMILSALPITLGIVSTGILFGLVIAVPLGLLPAFGVGMRGVRVLRMIMVVVIALPSFLIGLYLLLIFSVQLGLAPTGGWSSVWPETLRYVWLPALALAIFLTPLLVRSIERTTSQTMGEEFVESALSRGFSRTHVVVRHVLPNTLLPIITLVGFSFTVMIGGSVIVEAVYGIPGLGSVITRAVGQRDYPVIIGVTVFTGMLAVIISLITDVLYALADPRVRTK